MSYPVVKLGQLCHIELGKTPYRADKSLWDKEKKSNNKWLSIADIPTSIKPVIYETKEYISHKGAAICKLVPQGTLMVSFKLSLGRLAYAGSDLFTNEAIASIYIKNKKEIIKDYLYWYFMFFDWNKAAGSDIKIKGKTLNKAKLKEIDVFTPVLEEQKQIVSILDKAFEAIAQAIANTERNLKNAREAFNSYLDKVFRQKGDEWIERKLGEVCELATGGTPNKSRLEYFDRGTIRWLVSGDIHQKEIFDCAGRITEEGLNNSNAKYLPKNSVMIALNGQGKTRGSVAILRTKATCNQSLVSINPKDISQLLPEYLYINLHGRYNEIRKITCDSGNDRRGLNMSLIRSISIPVPPLKEQKQIAAKLDKLSTETTKLEAIYRKKLESLKELKRSILQKAFTGELTNQKQTEGVGI